MYKSHIRIDAATSHWLVIKIGHVQLLRPSREYLDSRSEEVARVNMQAAVGRYLLL